MDFAVLADHRIKLKEKEKNDKYINERESVFENETHKILWDFKMQTDHLILARRPVLINKKIRT